MKKFIVTAIAVFISLSAFAQYIGGPENLQPIYGTRVLGVKVDFDSVRLIGLPMSDYQEANDDLIRDKQEIYDDFVEDLNDRIRKRKDGLTCTSLGSAPYSIASIPQESLIMAE